MDGNDVQKEMLKLWRSSWDSYMKTLDSMGEQGQKMLDLMLEQSESIADEAKKTIKETAENSKKLQDQFKSAFEDSIKKMEDMLGKD